MPGELEDLKAKNEALIAAFRGLLLSVQSLTETAELILARAEQKISELVEEP